MLRYLLVFVIGALLGANVAWYYARHGDAPRDAAGTQPNPVATPATGATAAPSASASTSIPAPMAASTPPVRLSSGLAMPVAGVAPSQLVDTYTQARGEGRVHDAIDIMAPAGTPVLAAVDGPVAKLFDSERGGLTLYQFDDAGRRVYYYAHLQGYAAGLAEGQRLRQGQVIGYVGSTGNASPDAPHLHFTVGDLGPDRHWAKSTPVNPYPLLAR